MDNNLQARKDKIMKKIGEQPFVGVFVRREKSKGNCPRFYIYHGDPYALVITSEFHRGNYIAFRISCTTNGYDPKDAGYLGKIEHKQDSPTYEIYLPHEDKKSKKTPELKISYQRAYERGAGTPRHAIIESQDLPNFEQVPFSNFYEINRDITLIESEKNFVFKGDDGTYLCIGKIHEDEYHISCKGNISIFNAFCIALTTMYRVKSE